jgi:esterase/lipase superfamily enzyme
VASRGRVGSYIFDGEEVQIAEKYFVEFFDVIASIPDVDEFNILAHSMGNRLLMRSIERIAMRHSTNRIKTRVGQIVLAAADVSAELFRQHAHWYHALAGKRVTSYSCSQDLPLQSSRLIHGHHRVGLEPPVFLCSGADSVSAADLDLHALGHSYYADAEPLLYDIADLLHNDTHPDHRVRLEPATGESGNYWIFRK